MANMQRKETRAERRRRNVVVNAKRQIEHQLGREAAEKLTELGRALGIAPPPLADTDELRRAWLMVEGLRHATSKLIPELASAPGMAEDWRPISLELDLSPLDANDCFRCEKSPLDAYFATKTQHFG